jgi:hypothetical protein
MKNLIDAGEWQSFHQTRLSLFGPGVAFSILMQPSLPQRCLLCSDATELAATSKESSFICSFPENRRFL